MFFGILKDTFKFLSYKKGWHVVFFCLGKNISKTGQKYYVSERINIKGDDGSFTRYKKSNTGSS